MPAPSPISVIICGSTESVASFERVRTISCVASSKRRSMEGKALPISMSG